ncbi:hypothetical protein QBC38DRAFT_481375 [Podospora fimiseda]|uniref:Uncharacterized protein n=1 Tax=Podospora fimiseda TaxID=252190 RepID=A0AAN7BMT1_9PEZI|nr:hypothetical protein QBC38DRAFT_481375 [Podospora fimiseda]
MDGYYYYWEYLFWSFFSLFFLVILLDLDSGFYSLSLAIWDLSFWLLKILRMLKKFIFYPAFISIASCAIYKWIMFSRA